MMTSKAYDIERILFTSVRLTDTTTPRQFTGAALTEADKSGLWLNLHHMRAASNVATLGAGGQDNHKGLLQVDVNVPMNQGSKEALEKADEIASYYTAGKRLSTGEVPRVVVVNTTISTGRETGQFYRVSVTMEYYARTKRR